jgi:hypothetical protein
LFHRRPPRRLRRGDLFHQRVEILPIHPPSPFTARASNAWTTLRGSIRFA